MRTDEIIVDTKGRTYLLGSWFGGQQKVARLNPRGGLDQNFGLAGFISLDRPGFTPAAIVLDRAGGLFIVGSQSEHLAVIHRHRSGKLDRGFGNGGSVLSKFRASGDFGGTEAALDPRGRLLIGGLVGIAKSGVRNTSFLARYLTH